MTKRWVFDGHIAGIGTESGLRVVVGLWQQSPFGAFADAMVELPSGHRILLAPTAEAGDFRRQEYYGVTDLHRIDSASVGWDGGDAGSLAAIRPAVTFGFSSVPLEPSLARVRTTVLQAGGGNRP